MSHFKKLKILPCRQGAATECSRQKKDMMIRATRECTGDRFQDKMEAEKWVGLLQQYQDGEAEQGCVPWKGAQVSYRYRRESGLDGPQNKYKDYMI